jgi:hypothetical protein
MRKIALFVAVMLAVGGAAVAWFATDGSSSGLDPTSSPIAGSKEVAPKVAAPVQTNLPPSRELMARQRMSQLGSSIPSGLPGLTYFAKAVAPLLASQEKTPAGTWMLSHYYREHDKALEYAVHNDTFAKELAPVFLQFVESQPKSPYIFVEKAKILKQTMLSAEPGLDPKAPNLEAREVRFDKLMDEYQSYMQTRNAVAETDPEWFKEQLRSIGYKCERFSELWPTLETASARFPDYNSLYAVAILTATQCEPGQAVKHIKRIVDQGVERTKATDGEGFYVRIFWSATGFFGDAVFDSPLIDWPRMKRAMTDVMTRYPDAWNVNHFAKFACIGHQAELARELMPKVMAEPMMTAWEQREALDNCYAWAMSTATTQKQHLVP